MYLLSFFLALFLSLSLLSLSSYLSSTFPFPLGRRVFPVLVIRVAKLQLVWSLLTSSVREISLSSPFPFFFFFFYFLPRGTFIVFSLHLTLSTLGKLVHTFSMSITCLEIIIILFTRVSRRVDAFIRLSGCGDARAASAGNRIDERVESTVRRAGEILRLSE